MGTESELLGRYRLLAEENKSLRSVNVLLRKELMKAQTRLESVEVERRNLLQVIVRSQDVDDGFVQPFI
jgi:hypothetical protein